jgi:hypothetical protein
MARRRFQIGMHLVGTPLLAGTGNKSDTETRRSPGSRVRLLARHAGSGLLSCHPLCSHDSAEFDQKYGGKSRP